ncbi:hypothetical protein FRIGORI9N_100015 [Frigoribacterium sp. 9N]|nr:hypothetical protein FRIGORI9N_100015 [Frigoribacterium sp. 9N]
MRRLLGGPPLSRSYGQRSYANPAAILPRYCVSRRRGLQHFRAIHWSRQLNRDLNADCRSLMYEFMDSPCPLW